MNLGEHFELRIRKHLTTCRVRGTTFGDAVDDFWDTCRMYPRPVESAPELFQLRVTNVEATVMGKIWMCSDCKMRGRKSILT